MRAPSLLIPLILATGCFSRGVRDWAADEVRVAGIVYLHRIEGKVITLQSDQGVGIALDVKNIESWSDGVYRFAIPQDWDQSTFIERSDDLPVIESAALGPMVLLGERRPSFELPDPWMWLTRGPPLMGPDSPDPPPWKLATREELLGAEMDSGAGETVPSFAVEVAEENDQFRVTVFGRREDLQRWVELGSTEIGPGTQSAKRSLGRVLLTFPALALDVAIAPLHLTPVCCFFGLLGADAMFVEPWHRFRAEHDW